MLAEMFNLPSGPAKQPSLETLDPETVEMTIAGRAQEEARAAVAAFSRDFCSEPALDEALSDAYYNLLPPSNLRQRYRELYNQFGEFLRTEHNTDAPPIQGELVAGWLLKLAALEHRPLSEVKEAADALDYYRRLLSGQAFIDAALSIAAKIGGGDDGGGKELDGGDEAPADNIVALPLAATAPQQTKGN